jgi:hypothetical protein
MPYLVIGTNRYSDRETFRAVYTDASSAESVAVRLRDVHPENWYRVATVTRVSKLPTVEYARNP